MTRRVRIGLAGLGRMGRIHAANLSGRCPSAHLACVFDTDAGAARQAGERFEVPWVTSYQDMLADDRVEAVAIADAGSLARGSDIVLPARTEGTAQVPVVVLDDEAVRVSAVAVMHGRAVPSLAYRFDTADGSVVFSGDTSMNDDLIALARGADILVHHVADLGYLERHGTDRAELARMAALHTDITQVGGVAERARVRELILSHYLPADPGAVSEAEWARRAGQGFSGTTTAGRDGLRRTLDRAPS